MPAPSNKRSFTFDLDDDNNDGGDDGEFGCAGPLITQQRPAYPSNHALIPQPNSLQPQTNNSNSNLHRHFATPRTRFLSSKQPKPPSLEGQENITHPMTNIGRGALSVNTAPQLDFDFEDAEFLEAREEVEGGGDEFMDG